MFYVYQIYFNMSWKPWTWYDNSYKTNMNHGIIVVLLCILRLTNGVKFTDITTEVFGKTSNSIVAAFGDFDADRIVDVFMLTSSNDGLF